MRDFFGLSKDVDGSYGYLRTPEGAWSWQHLLQVSIFIILMVALAIFFGKKYKNKTDKEKNKVIIACAILINGCEIINIIVKCIRVQDPLNFLYQLPLFLCTIQLIAIPMAAFCKGRVKEACLDFVLTFGILGAIFGTVGATQNYNAYPVMSSDNVFSCVTHSISGFASLYIAISGLVSLKKENYVINLLILLGFSVMAYVANIVLDYNYMFLMHHDGTPYSIIYNLVGGNAVIYSITVVAIFVVYLTLFYYIYLKFIKKKSK